MAGNTLKILCCVFCTGAHQVFVHKKGMLHASQGTKVHCAQYVLKGMLCNLAYAVRVRAWACGHKSLQLF
jgi:hypothetical protein